jgi:hypothetical protein
MNRRLRLLSCFVVLLLVLAASERRAAWAVESLLTVRPDMDLSTIETRDVRISIGERDGQSVLCLAAGHQQKWPGITLVPAEGAWNLSEFETVSIQVRNTGQHSLRFGLRADSPEVEGQQQTIQVVEEIAAGQQKTVRLPLNGACLRHCAASCSGCAAIPAN